MRPVIRSKHPYRSTIDGHELAAIRIQLIHLPGCQNERSLRNLFRTSNRAAVFGGIQPPAKGSEVKAMVRRLLGVIVGTLAVSQSALSGPTTSVLTVADFNQDGVTDILAEKTSGSDVGVLRAILIDSATGLPMDNQFPIRLQDGYEFLAVGNFNGNPEGQSQIAARKMCCEPDDELGGVRLWDLTDDASAVAGPIEGKLAFIPDPMYKLVGIGDLDGNGVDDFVFVHDSNGPAEDRGLVRVYLMNAKMELTQIAHPLNVSDFANTLEIFGVADADGNGTADFIFASREGDPFPNLRVLLMAADAMDGITVSGQRFPHLLPATSFDFLGFALIDPDRRADLVFSKNLEPNKGLLQVRTFLPNAENLSQPFFPVHLGPGYDYIGNGSFDSDTETDLVLMRNGGDNEGLLRVVLLDTDSVSDGVIDADDQAAGQIKGSVFPVVLTPTLWEERSSPSRSIDPDA